MAVLRKVDKKILVIMALVYSLSVWYLIKEMILILMVLSIKLIMTTRTDTSVESAVPPK